MRGTGTQERTRSRARRIGGAGVLLATAVLVPTMAAGNVAPTPAAATRSTSADAAAQVQVQAASVGSSGAPVGNLVGFPRMSADGDRVLFYTMKTDVDRVAPGAPRSGRGLYLRDRAAGTTELVSARTDGTAAPGDYSDAVLSGDGRYAAFSTDAPALLPERNRQARDANKYLFIKDTRTGVLQALLPPTGSGIHRGMRPHVAPRAISASGRYIALTAVFDNAQPAHTGYLYDRVTGRWQQLCPLSIRCDPRAISGDGRYVALHRERWPHEVDPFERPYLFDRHTGTARRVPVPPRREDMGADQLGLALSDNGRVLVVSWGIPLSGSGLATVHDTRTLRVLETIERPGMPRVDAVDGTGRHLLLTISRDGTMEGWDEIFDAYRYDRRTGRTVRVSRTATGGAPNATSGGSDITADGRTVLFLSDANNIVPGDQPAGEEDPVDAFTATLTP